MHYFGYVFAQTFSKCIGHIRSMLHGEGKLLHAEKDVTALQALAPDASCVYKHLSWRLGIYIHQRGRTNSTSSLQQNHFEYQP